MGKHIIEHAMAGTGDPHLRYLERLLRAAGNPAAGGEFLYVTRTEGKPGFWELLGLRMAGMSHALLGAVHFQAQSEDPMRFARRSIGHFLSSPPQSLSLDRASYPADLVELRVPREGETVPDLLGRLKRDEPTGGLYLDAGRVELAFDFRPENPSLQRPRGGTPPGQRLLFRTRDGHVVTGMTSNLSAKLRRAESFIALTGVRQLLAGRSLALPTLVIHRSFLTMLADYPEGGIGPGTLPDAFSPATANPFHLLDPRLDVTAAAAATSGSAGSGVE
ncbi:MAG TPA: hypothetical protein VJG13_12750 [Thermoanaerobaculia bacterium]|nr:hypothetical protein [Thermoanaerobaculia bacterium]